MNDQRNLFAAIAVSVLILVGWQYFFPSKPPTPVPAAQTVPAPGDAPLVSATPTPGVPGLAQPPAPPGALAPAGLDPVQARSEALTRSRRISIETPSLHGSIALTGARIDDLTLVKYRETPDPNSPEITLLSPAGAVQPYWAEFGFVPTDRAVRVPGSETVWNADSSGSLTPDHPVVLSWDNGEGLRFVRTFTLDENYLFQVTQRVENYGTTTVALHPFALLARTGTPHTEDMYILHEGPLGVFDGTLKEVKYADLKKEGTSSHPTTGGWVGLTDKYWLAALAPADREPVTGRFVHQRIDNTDRYQVDYLGGARTLAPGASLDTAFRLFAGAKQVSLLDAYADKYGIDRFDLAIDFGWFYFLTKPFFYLLKLLHSALGNMGLAILAMTVILKLAMFPLANKSYVSMSKMKKLQPAVQALQARFGEDKMRLQQEMMILYKKEKVNPLSGCLPVLVQIPVFFALYKVLFVTIEMRHAPFYGWIHDLSVADPTNVFTAFGLLPWSPPGFLHLGLWPLIMGVTMYFQQKLNPQPPDPVQAKVMSFLPVLFTFLLANFSSGLVIYWAWNNALSILQQWTIMRRLGVKP